MKIRPARTELFIRRDGRTDPTVLIVAVRNFASAGKNTKSRSALVVGAKNWIGVARTFI